ncbi:glycosyltransferase [Verrucomicrobium sp. BvORR034]|uniref:glycosyltransferase family 4 protein n=1 Tax=Verrucomicrobium sp. BvORR034 TaxID=1396418 RepID=UPI000679E1CE|nr:glycosyltransferase [Verrucomicrobium sp. BvORR034]
MKGFDTAYFLTHPIQYQTPLLQALEDAGLGVNVLYASDKATWNESNWRTQVPVNWDIPLLDGYSYQSLNDGPLQGGFWTQLRHYRSQIRAWLKVNPTLIAWVHGWGNPYALAALLESRRAGARIVLRGESHLDCLRGPWWRKAVHRMLLGTLFKHIDHFLAIGSANLAFYKAYGVGSERISFMPYVVDNDFFRRPALSPPHGNPFLAEPGRPIVLYTGKLAHHKAVDVLIEGIHRASQTMPAGVRPRLVLVGEGEQRPALEALAERLLPGDVWFAGFRNQTEMPAFYALADIFVLPSSFEPWGLVVNEAMNSSKPIVVSDMVGARHDLVKPGVNGVVFKSGNASALAEALDPLLANVDLRDRFGRASLEIINQWGIPQAVDGWRQVAVAPRPLHTAAARVVDNAPPKRLNEAQAGGTISVSYAYVHNAYQQAEAASDAGRLEKFYCSCLDAEGHWGSWIGRLAGRATMASRSGVHLQAESVVENPWPLLRSRLSERMSGAPHHDWIAVSAEFDRWVAPRLEQDPCDLLLCYETGARESFTRARELGKRCLLDCPQFHPDFLWDLLAEAAEHCSLPPPPPIDTPETARRKADEFSLAHHFLVYSPLHATSFLRAGFKQEQIHIAPLWIDPELWYPESRSFHRASHPLKLLFVGGASLRKGIPFLLKAMRACGNQVHLTLAGEIDSAMLPLIKAHESQCTFVGPQTKPTLRRMYASHDLLVLPSIADAFGFVALEAMACGIPALVSDKCGVPVPDESWRVPALSSLAIQARFEHYIRSPDALIADGVTAQGFASGFTANVFRRLMQQCYDNVLQSPFQRD